MEELYLQDPRLSRFSARVLSCTPEGSDWAVVLDQTAFYPEGGGQPWDTGVLGDAQVTAVRRRDGHVVHTCDRPLEPGAQVEGRIDWARRFDLMQQHSGEHIVSGLAHQFYGCENVGFHMGAQVITIDFDRPLDSQQLRHLEDAANRYLWENRPVEISYPSQEELSHLAYRSKKELTGQVRIVTFPGADVCACCGTHVSAAGEIGLIKLLSCQKFRSGVRIELVCGGRAWDYLSQVAEQNHKVSNLLSVKEPETAQGVTRLLEETQALKSRIITLEEARFSDLTARHRGEEDVLLFEPGLSPDSLRRLTDALMEGRTGLIACFSGDDTQGYRYAMGQSGGNLRPLCTQMNQALSGRGGGKPDFVQGSLQATREQIQVFFASQSR